MMSQFDDADPIDLNDDVALHRPDKQTDRRRHRRIELACLGRFMRADKSEAPCRMIDISVGGASVASGEEVVIGEHIVFYFDEIGRIEGPVTRRFEGGFAASIQATQHRREKLAAQLTWLLNRALLGAPDTRRHDRVEPSNPQSMLSLSNGTQVPCRVLDVSISGASIELTGPIEIGTDVMLGRLRAKVVRQHDQGVGLRFVDIQNPQALRRHFG